MYYFKGDGADVMIEEEEARCVVCGGRPAFVFCMPQKIEKHPPSNVGNINSIFLFQEIKAAVVI